MATLAAESNPPVLAGEEYHDNFDTPTYLKQWCVDNERLEHYLRCFHDAVQSLPSRVGLSILDYGSGPSILTAISAATKASEIVLSDYTENNRAAVRRWLDKAPDAFDWTVPFNYVVKGLEGKTESEVAERQEQVRKVVKDVVPCDLTQDPPIEGQYYSRQYDVLVVSLVIACTSVSRDNYCHNLTKLGKMVKPGGILLLYEAERSGTENGYYPVGSTNFRSTSVSSNFVTEALSDAGFDSISVQKFPMPLPDANFLGFMFLQGRKQ